MKRVFTLLGLIGSLQIVGADEPGKYMRELNTRRLNKYLQEAGRYCELFLSDLAALGLSEDIRKEADELSRKCSLDRDVTSCSSLPRLLFRILEEGQPRCRAVLDTAFKHAEDIVAIEELLADTEPKTKEYWHLETRYENLKNRLDELIKANCSLCFKFSDYQDFVYFYKKKISDQKLENDRRAFLEENLVSIGVHSPINVLIQRSAIMKKAVEAFNAREPYVFSKPGLPERFNSKSYEDEFVKREEQKREEQEAEFEKWEKTHYPEGWE